MCFRSQWGAQLAVRVATRLLQRFADTQPELSLLSAAEHAAEEWLPQALAGDWADMVKAHLQQEPFSPQELTTLTQQEGAAALLAVETHPLLAYGATLLSVLVTDTFILYVQLGDGDILTVTETGEVTRPMPRDERLFGNVTTSLCAPEAWRDFRVRVQAVAEAPPALILLTTDGYANSFRDEAGFFQVGTDLLAIIRADALERVQDSLEAWLTETTQGGSGDDITLGVLCRMDTVSPSSYSVAEECG
jgi:hypothetical protein